MSAIKTHSKFSAPPFKVLLALSMRDLMHDRKVSVCIMASIVAVVAPLLLLFGLKFGIVSQMRAELLSDPRNLEIRMLVSAKLNDAWFDKMRDTQGVGFVLPLTRSLNAIADLYIDSRRFAEGVELIPTAPGDPVLEGLPIPQARDDVVLTASAAKRLGVKPGEKLQIRFSRLYENRTERAQVVVHVVGVLPPESFARAAVFLTLPLLVEIEDFRDGFKISGLGIDTGRDFQSREHFARARIYADKIENVEFLTKRLTEEGIETSSRLAEIKSVQAIDKVLGIVFGVIAWIAVLGCAASLIGALMANIDRKRKDLALLRLMGYGKLAMQTYVILQSAMLTLSGFIVGCAMYLLGSQLFNQMLGEYMKADHFVCRLEPIHFVFALAGALFLAMTVAGVGGVVVTKIEPAESLRDV